MKNKILILLLCIISGTVSAQLEMYGRYTENGKVAPDINIFGTKKVTKKVSLTYFTLIEEKWSEALVGVSYSPSDVINFGISAGIEHNPAIYRFGASIYYKKGNTSLLIVGEKGDGNDNYFYKCLLLSKAFSTNLRVGGIAWRYHGIGPVVDYKLTTGTNIWAVPAYDKEFRVVRFMLGVSIKI